MCTHETFEDILNNELASKQLLQEALQAAEEKHTMWKSEIVDPAKSVVSKAEEHIATVVASAKQAVSTPLADIWQNIRSKFFDDLTRWEDMVPVYFCLQTRGVWQLGYPNSTSKIVSSKDFDVLDALQITVLDSLFSMARQVVPGLPDGLVSDLAEVDFNVLDTMAAAAFWSLAVLLVGTFLMVLTSVLSGWTKWLLCLPLMVVGLLKAVLLVTALAYQSSVDLRGCAALDCLQATLTSLEEEVTRVNTSSVQLESEIQRLQSERHRQNILISLQSQYIALLEERLDFEESTGPLIEVSGIINGTNDDDKIRT
ncbi:hypothetical protein CABS02_15401 [Colletotrichum abscissum]|uniref:Transmembrane protein n=1 Tax=Colletotrichum abscissum TaxID=1671311 RepID=A0A9Q0AXB1_9PEZI|nr:hypothetical protein CABS02_15401 [Colletotrichum abscissum]